MNHFVKPILAISVIASVRGLLIIHMKIGTKEIDWNIGVLGMRPNGLVYDVVSLSV